LSKDFDSERCWQTIYRLINEWWGGLDPEDCIPEEEIVQAEQRLGINFPPDLRRWYLEAGNLGYRKRCFIDDFLLPNDVIINENGLGIFRESSDQDFMISIKLADLESIPLKVSSNWENDGICCWSGGVSIFSELILYFLCRMLVYLGRFQVKVLQNIPNFELERFYTFLFESEEIGKLYCNKDTFIWIYDTMLIANLREEVSLKKIETHIPFEIFDEIKFYDIERREIRTIRPKSEMR
jgi:hypothetical protein